MKIQEIMTTNVIRAKHDMTVQEASDIFTEHGFHHIPVVDDQNHVIGIVSDRDVMKHVSPYLGTEQERELDRDTLKLLVSNVMTADPITITEDSRIDTASILLLEHSFSCLPVMDDEHDTLKGIVTWKDLLNYYVYSEATV